MSKETRYHDVRRIGVAFSATALDDGRQKVCMGRAFCTEEEAAVARERWIRDEGLISPWNAENFKRLSDAELDAVRSWAVINIGSTVLYERNAIRRAVVNMKLRHRELSRRVGLPRDGISSYLAGRRSLNSQTIDRLLEILGVRIQRRPNGWVTGPGR